jgi:hypothetical protein
MNYSGGQTIYLSQSIGLHALRSGDNIHAKNITVSSSKAQLTCPAKKISDKMAQKCPKCAKSSHAFFIIKCILIDFCEGISNRRDPCGHKPIKFF